MKLLKLPINLIYDRRKGLSVYSTNLEIICITTIAYIGIKKQFIKSKITTKKESTEVD